MIITKHELLARTVTNTPNADGKGGGVIVVKSLVREWGVPSIPQFPGDPMTTRIIGDREETCTYDYAPGDDLQGGYYMLDPMLGHAHMRSEIPSPGWAFPTVLMWVGVGLLLWALILYGLWLVFE